MTKENQKMLLRDAGVEPSDKVLEADLGTDVFEVYRELLNIATDEFGLEYGWRYYDDGKAWLCKVVNKKKTVFWLSLWDNLVKTSFYFTEKTRAGVLELPVSVKIKDDFVNAPTTGRLIAFILDIDGKEQLNDFREIVKYKKSLK